MGGPSASSLKSLAVGVIGSYLLLVVLIAQLKGFACLTGLSLWVIGSMPWKDVVVAPAFMLIISCFMHLVGKEDRVLARQSPRSQAGFLRSRRGFARLAKL
jgi:hypothetical protein